MTPIFQLLSNPNIHIHESNVLTSVYEGVERYFDSRRYFTTTSLDSSHANRRRQNDIFVIEDESDSFESVNALHHQNIGRTDNNRSNGMNDEQIIDHHSIDDDSSNDISMIIMSDQNEQVDHKQYRNLKNLDYYDTNNTDSMQDDTVHTINFFKDESYHTDNLNIMTSSTSNVLSNHDSSSSSIDASRPTLYQHFVLTVMLWMLTVIISIFSSNLSVVLSLTGAIAASILGYIIPALIYIQSNYQEYLSAIKSIDKDSEHFTSSYLERWNRLKVFLLPFFMIFFGTISGIIGCITVFVENE